MVRKRAVRVSVFLLVSVLLLLLFASGREAEATNWDTSYTLTLSSYAPGANADVTTIFQTTAVSANNNFAKILSATGYPEADLAVDAAIPDGSSVGVITNTTTLSIFNGPCSTSITVTVPFMDCTTDTLKTAPWVGTGDNLVQDNDGDRNEDGSAASPGTGNCIDGIDNDSDTLKDGADPQCNNEATDTNGLPTYCDHYPSFLNDMYDPDGGGPKPPIRPRARYMGHQVVLAKAPATMLDFVIFNPEALSALPGLEGTIGDTYGFIDFVVLDNPNQPVSPSTITDFCSPLISLPTLKGLTDGKYTVTPGPQPYESDQEGKCANALDDDGDGWVNDGCLVKSAAPAYVRSKNPALGTGLYGTHTHVVRTYTQSQRDADGDGISNNLDSCPFKVNQGVDADADGLDKACDPNDASASAGAPVACTATSGIPDQDQDCFPNRQDNCPLLANNNADNDLLPPAVAADGGPITDGIGDACDNGTIPLIGTAETACNDNVDDDADTLADDGCTASPNFPNGHYHVALVHSYVCIGDTDTDLDGVCDATETLLGSNPNSKTSLPEFIGLDLAIGTGTAAKAPGTCSDFTVYNHPNTPAGGLDNDGDGKANAADDDLVGSTRDCGTYSSSPDADQDGVVDPSDNCVNEKNQEQVNRDGDANGDECDSDDDADGFGDRVEDNIGTDPKDRCPDYVGDDAWPLDFDMDKDADIVDVLKFKPVILKPKAPGGHRFDFDADGDIDIIDVLKFKPYILQSCAGKPGDT